MNTKQIQCLLSYLGYYVGNIDGIFGQMSATACEAFQKDYGLPATGLADQETQKALKHAVAYGMPAKMEPESFWDGIKYFKREEFRCKCGGKYCDGFPVEPDETMVRYADEIRKKIGAPLIVNSGVRCEKHNANVGGAKNSQHKYGAACDLGAPNGVSPEKMASIAESVIGETGGIGIYSWGIHIDSRSTKSRWNG